MRTCINAVIFNISGQSAASFQVRVGSTTHAANGTLIDVARIVQHQNFSFFTIDYDFSLLELAESISFDSTRKPIKLPRQGKQYPDDTPCLVTGWGNTQVNYYIRKILPAKLIFN